MLTLTVSRHVIQVNTLTLQLILAPNAILQCQTAKYVQLIIFALNVHRAFI